MSRVRKVLADRLYLSAIGVATVLVLSVGYLFASVLDAPLTSRPIGVTVVLGNTGGLFEGSAVTYRGTKIGKVTELTMTDEGAVARIRLRSGTEVPTDSQAQVRSLSPVGEQYLDFQPNTDRGPFLVDGARLEAAYTDLPASLSSTVVAINKVLGQVDERTLRSFLRELSTGLNGTGDDVGRLVDQGDLLLAELDRVWPETRRLIRTSDQALAIAPDTEPELARLGTSARRLASFLRDYDPELRRTLTQAPEQLAQLEGLVDDAQEVLPGFLTVGRQPHRPVRPARAAPAHAAPVLRAGARHPHPGDPRRRAQARPDHRQGPPLRLRRSPSRPARPHPHPARPRRPVLALAGDAAARRRARSRTGDRTGGAMTRRRTVTSGLLVVLSAALAAALVLVVQLRDDRTERAVLEQRAAAGQAAERAAREAVTRMTTYDAATVEEDFSWVDEVGTERFRESFAATSADVVDLVAELGSSAEGTVVDAAATVEDADRVHVLLFVDQELTEPGQDERRLEESRVTMEMVRSGGEWLVDEVQIQNLLTR